MSNNDKSFINYMIANNDKITYKNDVIDIKYEYKDILLLPNTESKIEKKSLINYLLEYLPCEETQDSQDSLGF